MELCALFFKLLMELYGLSFVIQHCFFCCLLDLCRWLLHELLKACDDSDCFFDETELTVFLVLVDPAVHPFVLKHKIIVLLAKSDYFFLMVLKLRLDESTIALCPLRKILSFSGWFSWLSRRGFRIVVDNCTAAGPCETFSLYCRFGNYLGWTSRGTWSDGSDWCLRLQLYNWRSLDCLRFQLFGPNWMGDHIR